MKEADKMRCPDCGSEDVGFELTPDKIHYGKFVCNACDRFIQWAKKPKRVKSVSGGICRFRGGPTPLLFVLTDMNGERLASVDLSDKELKPGEPIKVSWTILMG